MSLIDLRDEYEERAREILELLSLASSLEALAYQLDQQTHQDEIDSHLLRVNILKSSIHMMLYNQVENTARGCIESIYDHLQDNDINYSSLREKFQVNILHRIISDNVNGKSLYQKIGTDISKKIITASLNIRKEFNGNVCKPVLQKITQAYGITIANSPECRNGVDLDLLKDIRNELAHGSTSFSKKGQNDPLEEVKLRSERIDLYLRLLINSTENYITSSGYLSPQHA
ncbi:MAE_28990/MAE_18760 family HEPN-like nuclease [Kosakonia cowanii]|uniref:MAE_28990/MAE_18760 family HEPN-like nuclease n=1 Tax=Kosakonia TaxID=1330547 RepID=UPI002DDD3C74|nr:MAE_28990/MAE_18760 family HEPN-like nuclease [Kosakonia cowanii]WRY60129.1 MAE_28990/MAE_18760 family HEPN-like nuclease [Kosakonia cowanii]